MLLPTTSAPVNLSERQKQVIGQLQFEKNSSRIKESASRLLGSESTHSAVFNVVSEINRLKKTCRRPIDFRDMAKGLALEAYDVDGVRHVMDPVTKSMFDHLMEKYEGEYTIGVFEGVVDYFKSHKQTIKEKQIAHKSTLERVKFAHQITRQEERMNLAINISIYPFSEYECNDESIEKYVALPLRQDPIFSSKEIGAVTSNISLSGLKVRVPKKVEAKWLIVRFDGFESEFVMKQKYVAYEVRKLEHSEDESVLYLSQVKLNLHAEVNSFLKNLIFANKRRYRVSIDNTFESVVNSSYEQYFISRYNGLSLFYHGTECKHISYAEPSRELISFFSNKVGFVLPSIISSFNIDDIESGTSNFVVILKKENANHRAGSSYFCATFDSGSYVQFFNYVSKMGEVKVFKVSLDECDAERAILEKSSIPDDLLKRSGGDSIYRMAPRTEADVKKINKIVQVKEIDSSFLHKDDIKIPKDKIQSFNKTLVKKLDDYSGILCKLESKDYREEDRFKLATEILVTKPNGDVIECTTQDVSTKGFAAKVPNGTMLKKYDKILVTFSRFSDMYPSMVAHNIEYRVVDCKKNELRCRIPQASDHDGRKLLNKVIYDNIEKLKVLGGDNSPIGLTRVLRNLLSKHHDEHVGFFSMKESFPVVTKVANSLRYTGKSTALSSDYFSDDCLSTTKEMFFRSDFVRSLLLGLPKITSETPYQGHYVMVVRGTELDPEGIRRVKVWNASEIDHNIMSMASKLTKSGTVSFYYMSLTKKSRIFDKYFKHELKYLGVYASHKAMSIEKEIERITGLFTLTDITNAVSS